MRRLAWLGVLAILWSGPAPARGKKKSADATIVLNGELTTVRWSDGDSFRIHGGPYDGRGTRLTGYNTLESFGPVHRWGEWTAAALHALAADAKHFTAAQRWDCTTDGSQDGYRRLLVSCPRLTVAIVRAGIGMAYAVDGERPPAEVLEAQAEAQAAGRGMWAKGVVAGVVTSVHSADEDGLEGGHAYNRVVDTRTGEALKRPHASTYSTCQEVCETTGGQVSCMTYVPFERRYRRRPPCLTGH